MNLRIADLHTHSTYSDGLHSPSEVVDFAAAAGIGILSLTDHDTTLGLSEADAAAARAGIDFVPGIEISAVHEGEEYHILGYFIGPSAELDDYVDMMRRRRSDRVREIVRRLQQAGIGIDVLDVERYTDGLVTRAHVARCLVDGGCVATVREAFEKWLGPGCVGHVPAGVVSVADAIDVIHASGGCASLAHPGEWFRVDVIDAMRDVGLAAVEVVHPSHDERLTVFYDRLAAEKGLVRTGGSDLHAVSREPPGILGAYYVTSADVDALRACARRPTT